MQALLFYRRVSPALRSYLAAGCFVASAISLAIHVRRRDGAWRGVAVIGGLAWVILLASVVFDSGLSQVGAAVIMNDDTIARSADSRLAAQALPEGLPAGTEVEVLENRAEWARIRLHNGRDV